jgi:hypothetical protein
MTKRRRIDNTMAKRRRIDNTMAKRRRIDNTMAKRRRIDNTALNLISTFFYLINKILKSWVFTLFNDG